MREREPAGVRQWWAQSAVLMLLVAVVVAVASAPAPAATAPTTVSVTVASATNISTAACGAGAATNFGAVMAGTLNVTSAACQVSFGSSNDTASLRVWQQDQFGVGMFGEFSSTADTGFSGDGLAQTTFGVGSNSGVNALASNAGYTYAAGYYRPSGGDEQVAVSRWTSAGVLDLAYGGGDGVATFDVVAGTDDEATDIKVLSDGSAYVAINADYPVPDYAGVGHLLADGTWDPAFGTGGVAVPNSGAQSEWQFPQGEVLVASDGSSYVCSFAATGSHAFLMKKFTPAGALDAAWGAAGQFTYSVPGYGAFKHESQSCAMQTDGKIIISGEVETAAGSPKWDRPVILRVTTAGALDTTWNSPNGYVIEAAVGSQTDQSWNDATSVRIDSQGRVVVGLQYANGVTYDLGVVRYTPAGARDATFGTGGLVVVPMGVAPVDANDWSFNVMVMPDDSLAGIVPTSRVVRLTSTGTLDTVFDGDGITANLWAGSNWVSNLALGPDGDLMLGGGTTGGTPQQQVGAYVSTKVPDYQSGVADWSAGTNMFGICMATTTGTADWTPGACGGSNGAWWRGVSATSTVGSKAAHTAASGTTVTADFRFGFRTAPTQPAGTYLAPLVFEVLAPAT